MVGPDVADLVDDGPGNPRMSTVLDGERKGIARHVPRVEPV
jgi:hypothetical protein